MTEKQKEESFHQDLKIEDVILEMEKEEEQKKKAPSSVKKETGRKKETVPLKEEKTAEKAEKSSLALHQHHRMRKKQLFLKEGLAAFAPHEILELILYYSVPRRDTNPLAHELLSKFGSIEKVFDAPEGELLSIRGITENTVVLFRMIPALLEYYSLEKLKNHRNFSSVEDAAEFFMDYYQNKTEEIVTALLLDNSGSLISFEEIHHGSVNSSDVNPRKIAEIALKKNAASLILAHNHPSGTVEPSDADIRTTKSLNNAFSSINLHLRASLVIAKKEYYDIFDKIYQNANYSVKYLVSTEKIDDEELFSLPEDL